MRAHCTPFLAAAALAAAAPRPARAQSVVVSDGFERTGWDRCMLGAADQALGGSGSYFYLPIFPRDGRNPGDPIGARIVGGKLTNEGLDFGGVQLATAADPCSSTAYRGADLGADVVVKVDLFVPAGPCGQVTVAGPYFRSRAAARGDGIIGGESGGYWVQLASTGEVRVLDLNRNAIIATSPAPSGFSASTPHPVEVVAQGASLRVAVDGKGRSFVQGNASSASVAIPATGGSSAGTLGIAFGAPAHRGQIGGQTADNLVVMRGQPGVSTTSTTTPGTGTPTDLGSWWDEHESGHHGKWTRRGTTSTFDADWGGVTAVLSVTRSGHAVTVTRRQSSDKNDCDYAGIIAGDGVSIDGTYRCTNGGPYTWKATIMR